MPTKKLTDRDRDDLKTSVDTICSRVKYVHPFPLPLGTPEEQIETYKSLIPPTALSHIMALMQTYPSVVVQHDNPQFDVMTDTGKYNVRFQFRRGTLVPAPTGIEITKAHESYMPIVEWCRDQTIQVVRFDTTIKHYNNLVRKASSMGQVATAFPFLKDYIDPELAASLAGAVRRSRLPIDFKPDPKISKVFEHLLMVGSLLEDPDWNTRYEWPTVTWKREVARAE